MNRLLQSKVVRPQVATSSSSSSSSAPPPPPKKRVREDREPVSPAKKHRPVQMVDIYPSQGKIRSNDLTISQSEKDKILEGRRVRPQRRAELRAAKKLRVEESKKKLPFPPNIKHPVDLTLMKFFLSVSFESLGDLSKNIGYKKPVYSSSRGGFVDSSKPTNFTSHRVYLGKGDRFFMTIIVDNKNRVIREMVAPVVMGKESGRSVCVSRGEGVPKMRIPSWYVFYRYDNNFSHRRLSETVDERSSYIQCYVRETHKTPSGKTHHLRFIEDLFIDENGNMRVHRFVGGSTTYITSFGSNNGSHATTTTLIGNGYSKTPLLIKECSSIGGVSGILRFSRVYSQIDGDTDEVMRRPSKIRVRRKVYQGFVRFRYHLNPSFPYAERNDATLYDARILHKRHSFLSFKRGSLSLHGKVILEENDQRVNYYSRSSEEKRLTKTVDKESGMVETYDNSGRRKVTYDEISTIYVNDLFYSVTFKEREVERINGIGFYLDVVYNKEYTDYDDGVDYSRRLAGVIHNFDGARRVCEYFKLSMSHVSLWNWISICRHYPRVRELFSKESNSETYERFFLHRDFDQSNSALVDYAKTMKIPPRT